MRSATVGLVRLRSSAFFAKESWYWGIQAAMRRSAAAKIASSVPEKSLKSLSAAVTRPRPRAVSTTASIFSREQNMQRDLSAVSNFVEGMAHSFVLNLQGRPCRPAQVGRCLGRLLLPSNVAAASGSHWVMRLDAAA